MRDRQRLIAVSFVVFVVGVVAFPSSAEAGPLLDWLFHRNRTQGLAGANQPYTAGYGAGYAPAGYSGANPATSYGSTSLYRGGTGGSCLTNNCLFGRRSSIGSYNANAANNLASAPVNAAQTTARYGGATAQSGCGPGWCQQTVLRYVPQVAYRTAYQPVPVTTYKTSTTINPANGLPRTCTRPCTSYTYQARRVPYTTYRPVYTTVPVTDDWGQAQRAAYAPASNAQISPQPSYALQPPSAGGCPSCQNNGGASFQQQPGLGGNNVPGYTPGNSALPPAPSYGGLTASGNVPGATSWQPVPGAAGQYAPGYYQGAPSGTGSGPTDWQRIPGSDLQSYGSNTRSSSDIPWQPMPRDGIVTPPAGVQGDEAERRPALRIDSDEYYNNGSYADRELRGPQDRLKPVPMPEDIRRRLNNRPRSEFQPADRIDQAQTRQEAQYRDLTQGGYFTKESVPADDRLFSTPDRPVTTARPQIEPPANHDSLEIDETRRRRFDSRAVRDLDRERSNNRDDKTATNRARGKMPIHEDAATPATRYAAVPIDWSMPTRNRLQNREGRRWPAKESNRALQWQVR